MIRSRERFCILHGCVTAWSPSRSSCAEGRVVAVKRKNRRVPASIHRAAQPRHHPIRQTERPNSATRPSSFVAHDAFALDHDLHDLTCTQCSSKIKSLTPLSPLNVLPDLHLASPPARAITNANPGSLATTDGHWERHPTSEVWTGDGVMGTSVSQSFLTMKTVLTISPSSSSPCHECSLYSRWPPGGLISPIGYFTPSNSSKWSRRGAFPPHLGSLLASAQSLFLPPATRSGRRATIKQRL